MPTLKTRIPALAAVAVTTFLLAACGSTPAPVSTPGADATPAKPSPRKAPKGGGYYKDDGPADELPDGLDDTPDAVPRPEPLHRFANRPYVVFGKEYVPNTRLKPHRERGIGSWYGKKFHGQKTSIGEPYDMFSMTAAHPTLAIPSYARVTNVANGRSVVVRITDRGPFHANRIIDLSYAAAHRLDYIRTGSAAVEVEAILPDATGVSYAQVSTAPPQVQPAAPRPTADSETSNGEQLVNKLAREEKPVQTAGAIGLRGAYPAGSVLLQLGAFASADNAESMRNRLLRELDRAESELRINSNGGIHRLHLGPFASRAEAERAAERIRQDHGFKPTFVTP